MLGHYIWVTTQIKQTDIKVKPLFYHHNLMTMGKKKKIKKKIKI